MHLGDHHQGNIHHQKLNGSECHIKPSQTLQSTLLVLFSNCRCSQNPLELNKVFSDAAEAFSGATETICSNGGTLQIVQYLAYRKAKIWSSCKFCTGQLETSRATETAAYSITKDFRLAAVLSWEWSLESHSH